MHPLEAHAHGIGWEIVEQAPSHAQRAFVAHIALAAASLVACAATLVLNNLALTAMLVLVMAIAGPLGLWYFQRSDYWIASKQGMAASALGRTYWMSWEEILAVVPEQNSIDRWLGTVVLKLSCTNGKMVKLPAMSADKAAFILSHLEPSEPVA